MTTFFDQTQTVTVSRYCAQGWWKGNFTEHVVKGTGLGPDCTLTVYSPSRDGVTARFNTQTQVWSEEIDDATLTPFYGPDGEQYALDYPDGSFPDWAIFDAPPEHDRETQTVLHTGEAWTVYDIKMGVPYWDAECRRHVVNETCFTLPADHTWEAPPNTEKGFCPVLKDGQWQIVEDYRGQTQFDKKDATVSKTVTEAGPLPRGWTLKAPATVFDVWKNNRWQYDQDKARPAKSLSERRWRDAVLAFLLQRLEQFERDLQVAEQYRTGTLTAADYEHLLADRKRLCDYPDAAGFPFADRPTLSAPGQALADKVV
ncbi:hypothetical protein P4S70_01970 [Enterovibrio sp. Hal110]